MHKGQVCGRPIYSTAADPTPVCLMHSVDPNKNTVLFDQEFDRIIAAAAASNTIADFTRFVFFAAYYPLKKFPTPCIFDEARFDCEAKFSATTFAQEASFQKTIFGTENLHEQTDFTRAHFLGKATFHTTTFWGEANFSADFQGDVSFVMSNFENNANFASATFTGEAYFGSTQFKDDGVFPRAVFKKEASFTNATFFKRAFFAVATFEQDADFFWTTFTLEVHLLDTKFFKQANFRESKFLGPAEFRGTQFLRDRDLLPSLVFTQAEFTNPNAILFYKTDLSHALFHDCDASQLNFSSVEWRTRPNGKRRLFEELVDLSAAPALQTGSEDPNERDYGLIAEIYQQLKKNYDNRQDYWTAGDFHYGEMEMKRLHSPRKNKAVRWLHRHLGLVAWYRYASEYGESYGRPLLALLVVLVVFTLLFPIPGMVFNKPDGSNPPPPFPLLNYGDFSTYIRSYKGPAWIATLAFFGHSLMTALSVAGFQKELIYQPAYPWGRALALFELLLTSTLIALFLLALRRQFRR
jgi:uncharacterized protein YjbI with pentapeptide repeats